ncbi:MAG: inositol monophosphatase family protein [Gammaproteobacteria bacterium]
MKLLKQVEKLAVSVSKKMILPHFASAHATMKSDGSLVTDVDVRAHAELSEQLVKLADLPVLSEEMAELQQRAIIDAEGSDYWCIDPIDGTSNFVYGVPYWGVSIALIIEGQIKLGVVYDPNRDECFSASDKSAATLNGQPSPAIRTLPITELRQCLGLIDFKRLPQVVAQTLATDPPYRSQRSFGASALDLCWIAAERCHLYLHGKQKLWDHAAGLLILKQAGAQAETFDGETVFQNNLEPRSVLAASREILMKQWKTYFREINTLRHDQKT